MIPYDKVGAETALDLWWGEDLYLFLVTHSRTKLYLYMIYIIPGQTTIAVTIAQLSVLMLPSYHGMVTTTRLPKSFVNCNDHIMANIPYNHCQMQRRKYEELGNKLGLIVRGKSMPDYHSSVKLSLSMVYLLVLSSLVS